jgi:hypothetical protein
MHKNCIYENVGGKNTACSESCIRFPTDRKLFWENNNKIFDIILRKKKRSVFWKECNYRMKKKRYL